jgi:hypothetical protein
MVVTWVIYKINSGLINVKVLARLRLRLTRVTVDAIVENIFQKQSLMHIQYLGLNHIAAPLGLREQLSFNEDGIRTALARLACGHITTSIV